MKIRFRKSNFMAGRGNACRPVLQRGESKGYGIRKAPLRNSQRRFKVAATYSPTTQCSTIGDAFSLPCALAPLRCLPPLLATQLSALSPARRRRAHRRPPRASDALDMVSLKKVSLSFSSDHWAHEVIVELVASWEV